VHASVDAAYDAIYDRHGRAMVGSVTGSHGVARHSA
jgi:hypothetical protein